MNLSALRDAPTYTEAGSARAFRSARTHFASSPAMKPASAGLLSRIPVIPALLAALVLVALASGASSGAAGAA